MTRHRQHNSDQNNNTVLLFLICLLILSLIVMGAFFSGLIPWGQQKQLPASPPPVLYGDVEFHTGWIDDQDAVKTSLISVEQIQGFIAKWAEVFVEEEDNDHPVFLWATEEKVLGKMLPSWNQGQIGSCVAHGWGRACQDLILIQIVAGGKEEWPGAEVCRETIYGGSRVEAGHDGGGGDGSTGGWAAQWCSEWGVLFYKKYGNVDLADGYNVSRCKQYGSRGVPDELESVAKEHPVKGVAKVTSAEQAWQALGSGYPIPICSNVGFQSPLVDGFCKRSGSWAHCMEIRARFVHPTRGRCFVIQNSWGDYLAKEGGDPEIDVKGQGKVKLPQGCFGITSADADVILRQNDSYAISSFRGFPARKIDWLIKRPQIQENRYGRGQIKKDRHDIAAPWRRQGAGFGSHSGLEWLDRKQFAWERN